MAAIDHRAQSGTNDMLRPRRIHIVSIKIRMAGFQLREKSADAFLEDAFVRGSQGGGLLIDFSTPFPVIDISDIEMVLEN
jgi:hypothetical protein